MSEERKPNDGEKSLLVMANWAQGDALSGGDRIFIELCRRWAKKIKIHIITSVDGWKMCKRSGVENVDHSLWCGKLLPLGTWGNYLWRSIRSVWKALSYPVKSVDMVYSSSDFWPDALPAFILKLRKKEIKWIAGFYLFAPAPFSQDSPYKGNRWMLGFLYYLCQMPVYWIVNNSADLVFVTSQPDVRRFLNKKRDESKIIIIRGGVDIKAAKECSLAGKDIDWKLRKYDACFIGRLHYQKGPLELIDIWNKVCCGSNDFKLIIIGEGPLQQQVKNRITALGLDGRIEMAGFKDGKEKYEIFKQSKIVLHPATYDSGGMAAAEAMAWGLPAISYDLEALRTYYPQGMLKVKCFDKQEFAEKIKTLLSDKKLYEKIKQEAIQLIETEWNWDCRADLIFQSLKLG